VPIPATDSQSAGSLDGTQNIYPYAPSAVYDPQADGSVFKIFFSDYNDTSFVKMVTLDANRNLVNVASPSGPQPLFRLFSGTPAASNVQVIYNQYTGVWYMWYSNPQGVGSNGQPSYINIYEVKMVAKAYYNYPIFNVQGAPLIANSPAGGSSAVCGTNTPGVLLLDATHYELFFSQIPNTTGDNNCYETENRSIQMWSYTLN